MGIRSCHGLIVAACLTAACAHAAEKVDFKRDVQPIFKANCYGCHGPSQQMNGFRLDRRSAAMRGGTIAVIGAGSSSGSRLYNRLIGNSYGMQMPPTGPLSDQQIKTIKDWIDQGAEWPDDVAGEAPPPPPDPKATALMDSLRAGDLAAVRKALAADKKVANRKGPGGSTPLMYAVEYGDAAMVRQMLDAGADPNVRNDSGATAIIWAAGDLEKTKLLVEHGADVNARSDAGRTPLAVAASRFGNGATVKLLLDKGADPNAQFPALLVQSSIVAEAIGSGDPSVLQMLIDRGADPSKAGFLPLFLSIQTHCAKCTEILLKSATPAITNPAMFMLAPPLGDGMSVDLMLEHGADANAKDPAGNPIIALVAASDHNPVDAIKSLIAHGADVNSKDSLGDTALDIAKRRGHTPIVDLLVQAGAKESAKAAPSLMPKPADSPRAAVARSIPLLQKSDALFLKQAGCVSCHNNTMTAVTVAEAKLKGIVVDNQTAAKQLKSIGIYIDSWRERALQGIGIPGDADTVAPILMGMAAQNYQPDAATDAMAAYLKGSQVPNGMWHTIAHRPPLETSNIMTTVESIRALQVYAPKAQRAEYLKSIDLARSWLLQQKAEDVQDRAFQLMGFAWTDVDRARIQQVAKELLAVQRPDGGWSQLPTLASDAYSTGQALVGLSRSGAISASDPAYQRGVQFLMKSQLEDGSWYVQSRAARIQPYFESGFPHGHDQWISACATNWAAMALIAAVK